MKSQRVSHNLVTEMTDHILIQKSRKYPRMTVVPGIETMATIHQQEYLQAKIRKFVARWKLLGPLDCNLPSFVDLLLTSPESWLVGAC